VFDIIPIYQFTKLITRFSMKNKQLWHWAIIDNYIRCCFECPCRCSN